MHIYGIIFVVNLGRVWNFECYSRLDCRFWLLRDMLGFTIVYDNWPQWSQYNKFVGFDMDLLTSS